MQSPERRRRRSYVTAEALHLQLEAARTDSGLRAIVVADDDGFEIASSGDADECTELAAFAPVVARGCATAEARDRFAEREVTVRLVSAGHIPLYVCAAGASPARTHALSRVGSGARRILGLDET